MQGLMGIRFIKKFHKKNKRKTMSFYMDAVKPTRTAKVTCESITLENQPPQKKVFQQGNIEPRNDIAPEPYPQTEADVNADAAHTPNETQRTNYQGSIKEM